MIIFANILSSWRILKGEYAYHSLEAQNILYNRIDQDLPSENEENKILMVIGDYKIKVFGFEWNGFYPLALRRGIKNQKEFSTIATNLEDAKKLVCNQDSISKFKISELYSWQIQNSTIHNISEEIRLIVKKDCEDSKDSSGK